LDKARQRAREVNQKGALFPWRTINGEEASAYYAAGTAQYHINADIMYGLKKYVEVTGDEAFLHEEGAEMLVETARMWNDLGFYSKRKGGKFCIHGVTGPDEYNTVVNNNTFTNLMARENLRYATETVESLRNDNPEHFVALVDKTALDMSEVEEWREAADNMYIPFDEDPPAGRQLPRQGGLGLKEYASGQIPTSPVSPSPRDLSACGNQASRYRAGHVSSWTGVFATAEEAQLRLLRPINDWGLLPLGLYSGNPGIGDRL
jgi:hypothetical protein